MVAEMEQTYARVPALKAIHFEPGDGPTECVALLGQAFRSQDWVGLFRVPSYSAWLHGACDMRPAYAYHRLALQLLQSRAPGRWSLKAPGHLFALRRAHGRVSRRALRRHAPRPAEDGALQREPLGDGAARVADALAQRSARLFRGALARDPRRHGRPADRVPRAPRRRRLRGPGLPRLRARPDRRGARRLRALRGRADAGGRGGHAPAPRGEPSGPLGHARATRRTSSDCAAKPSRSDSAPIASVSGSRPNRIAGRRRPCRID